MMAPAGKEEDKKIFSRLISLYEISKLLGSSLDLQESFPRVFSTLAQQMGMKRGGLLLRGDESSDWENEWLPRPVRRGAEKAQGIFRLGDRSEDPGKGTDGRGR
jgi:hypothetical protein